MLSRNANSLDEALPKPFWFVADNGRVCLQVRYGTRVLELAKGRCTAQAGESP